MENNRPPAKTYARKVIRQHPLDNWYGEETPIEIWVSDFWTRSLKDGEWCRLYALHVWSIDDASMLAVYPEASTALRVAGAVSDFTPVSEIWGLLTTTGATWTDRN